MKTEEVLTRAVNGALEGCAGRSYRAGREAMADVKYPRIMSTDLDDLICKRFSS
jgi:hypothetical protein